jgi:nucleoside-diphosphate-sugar epimerase
VQKTLLVFGLGYIGTYIAYCALKRGYNVLGTTQTGFFNCEVSAAYAHINLSEINALAFTNFNQVIKRLEGPITHILVTIPPYQGKDRVLSTYQMHLKRNPSLQWVGYLSTTGVYGDHKGAWVDEESPCYPSSLRTQERLSIEKEWLCTDLPIHIFRLSAIYGPHRNIIESLRNHTIQRINKPGHFFSRIHRDDIAQALFNSMARPSKGEIYNLADDLPCSSQEVIEYVAHLYNLPLPPLVEYDGTILSEMTQSFYQDSRKVKNTKIKNALGVKLYYPTYKTGMKNLCA